MVRRRGAPLTVLAAAGVAMVALAATACSGSSGGAGGLPAAGSSPSTASTTSAAAPTTSASATAQPTGANGLPTTAIAKVGTVKGVSGPTETAVNDAWQRYWATRMPMYGAAKLDPLKLSQVATGQAYSTVAGYIAGQRSKHTHTVGSLTVNVSGVSAAGAHATIRSCILDVSVDVNAKGKPVEVPSGPVSFTGTLAQGSGGWRVSKLTRGGGHC